MIKDYALRRFTCWYDPAFYINSAYYEHAAVDDRLEAFIEKLRIDIDQNGLINPVVVTIKEGLSTIHPGKCRTKACVALGWDTIPAIVVNYNNKRTVQEDLQPGLVLIDDDDQLKSYFSGDTYAKMTHRWVTVTKKR